MREKEVITVAITASIIALVISIIGLIGSLESQDLKQVQISDMKTTCERSYKTMDGQLEEACGRLIDQVQEGGEYEVTSTHGAFNAEKVSK